MVALFIAILTRASDDGFVQVYHYTHSDMGYMYGAVGCGAMCCGAAGTCAVGYGAACCVLW